MVSPSVQCFNLSKSFGNIRAVKDISISIEAGSTVALVGPSGCGKTTVLRLIAGFEKANSGEVTIRNQTVDGPGVFLPPEKRKVGMIFQDYALFPHLNVRQNVEFGLTEKPKEPNSIDAMLELVGLENSGKRMPHELSGGEQQRTALARALMPNPDVILLDEPFSNLDAGLRTSMRTSVRNILKEARATSILVTHDQDEALSFADSVAVMHSGTILQVGTPIDVYTNPHSLTVSQFIGDANLIKGTATDHLVETELGHLKASNKAQGPVIAVVRPENIRIGSDQPTNLHLEVIDQEFYGHDKIIKLRLPSGLSLKARCSSAEEVEPGKSVPVHIVDSVQIFPVPQ